VRERRDIGGTLAQGRQLDLDNPSGANPAGWTPLNSLTFDQLRPGDRFLAEDDDPAGAYIGCGTLQSVISYTDEDTDVTVQLSHAMTDEAPVNGQYLSFYTTSVSVGCIVARGNGSMVVGV